MRSVAVTAERSGNWWVLESAEAGAVSQSRTLAGADAEMREAIAYQLGLPADAFDIEVEVIAPEAYQSAMRRAAELYAEAERAAADAAHARSQAAKELAAAGLAVRDIGVVMGVSYQRAHQLLKAS